MDQTPAPYPRNSIVLTSFGWEASDSVWSYLLDPTRPIPTQDLAHDCQPSDFLQQRKSLKFMSKQDRLAVSAAGLALCKTHIPLDWMHHALDLFIAVGYIPFQEENARELMAYALQDGQFSMQAFTSAAYEQINPLLAFACLPNMPAHHVALNFGLQNSYFITYPGPAQLVLALQEAIARLQEGKIRFALVGGTADQTNFLVQHHFHKLFPDTFTPIADSAAFMLLETAETALEREHPPLARLLSLSITPFSDAVPADILASAYLLGAPGLPLTVAASLSRDLPRFEHTVYDHGFRYHTLWEAL